MEKELSTYNRASLAFIIREDSSGQVALMMGDGSYKVVAQRLQELKDTKEDLYSEDNPLKLDYLKLSHHGSICDLDKSFLKLITCNTFLISTDGSTTHNHPDRVTIARIYNSFNTGKFYFNYADRVKSITAEGGILETICKYKREF